MNPVPIYALRVADVFAALETSSNGLSASEAESRRSLYGSNLLSEPLRLPWWTKFAPHLTHPMALLLWGAGILILLNGEPVLGAIIWILVLVNAGFSFAREYRAEKAMIALRQLLPAYTRLIRDGAEISLAASEVVPGDVLVLAEGDNIPADARVIEEYGLRTNNTTLTGEAVPTRKTADASLREGISELERPNLVFAGTSIVSGTGRAVVYATGMLTQFGRIARLAQAVKEEPSPLQQELVRVTRVISLVALGLGGIVFLLATFDPWLSEHLRGSSPFLFAVGVIVAAIPEGLPATITLSLAMAAQRLAQNGVLVKKLSVIETLGTVSVICTDKSGTLTQNQMTVRQLWVGGQRLSVSGVGYEPHGSFTPQLAGQPLDGDLDALLTAAMLCNNSRLNPPTLERPQWTCLGDQTEAALRTVALKGGLSEETLTRMYPRIHELPFDARRKRMSTIHRNEAKSRQSAVSTSNRPSSSSSEIAYVKGAPREVLQLCTHILIRGQVHPLDESWREEILSANDRYSRRALRVLALARRELPRRESPRRESPPRESPPRSGAYSSMNVERELTFLGLAAMMDPPRPEVSKAMEAFQQANIRMIMITGDYGLTAESLARRVGMLTTPNPLILTGAELDALNDIELQTLLDKEVIFARMAPEHKLRLVAAFQARGEVVAVTGDGVNDTPALRKADVGVVMGISGTDVAKEAADVILVSDNFATIVNAIEEGRAVYDNLRKFITYIFSSNVPEILPFILTAIFHVPLALTVGQILAIDMGTDLFPALALGTEKPETDVMRRRPRQRGQRLLDQGLLARAFLWLGAIETILCYLGFLYVYYAHGVDFLHFSLQDWQALPDILNSFPKVVHQQAATVFLAGVVMAQIGNVLACRTEKARVRYQGWLSNRTLLWSILAEIAIALLLIYVWPLAEGFGHRPFPLSYWIGLIWFPLGLYLLEWVRKAGLRWWEQNIRREEASS